MSAPPAAAGIGDGSVAALLAGIAGTEPAPGSGAAGAIALALGVACARKAARLSHAHHPDRAALADADAPLAAIGDAAVAGADGDAARFTALMDALRLPHDSVRDAALTQRAAALVALGERLVALGEAAARLIDGIADAVLPSLANDILAARALIAANRAIQQANIAESRARLG